MEEMLLKMVSPNENRTEGLYVSRVYNGSGARRAWPDAGRSVSPVPALLQSLTDRWGKHCGPSCTAIFWERELWRGWESYSWCVWEMLALASALRGPHLSVSSGSAMGLVGVPFGEKSKRNGGLLLDLRPYPHSLGSRWTWIKYADTPHKIQFMHAYIHVESQVSRWHAHILVDM